jgi:hypothetical protein
METATPPDHFELASMEPATRLAETEGLRDVIRFEANWRECLCRRSPTPRICASVTATPLFQVKPVRTWFPVTSNLPGAGS